MDVTLMPRINMPGAEKRPEGTPAGAGDFGATRGASAGNVDGAVTPTTEIHDPVRRAEQTIGAFFEDEETPNARFSIDRDRDSGRFVYRLVDSSTGEVVKQFPGDYVLRRVAYYRELEGLAVDNEV